MIRSTYHSYYNTCRSSRGSRYLFVSPGLQSGIEYTVFVNAENGVSHLAFPLSFNITGFINLTTLASMKVITNTGKNLSCAVQNHPK